jgi:hypothetical protein
MAEQHVRLQRRGDYGVGVGEGEVKAMHSTVDSDDAHGEGVWLRAKDDEE